MQLFEDTSFFILLILTAIPAIVLGVHERPIRRYGFAVSILFVVLSMYKKPSGLLYLAAYCLLEWALIKGYVRIRTAGGRDTFVYRLFLALSLTPLVLYKVTVSPLLQGAPHIFGFIGISYMTFKTAQMIIEIYDGIIREASSFELLYLLLFFPAVTSGPIDRSRRFCSDIERVIPKDEYLSMVGDGIYMLFKGLMYKSVFGAGCYALLQWFGMGRDTKSVLIYMYMYGFYLFFDFAGYSLMAIGASKIFGVNTPANFNAPFISKDIKEFWDRWHITLSHWFRDYLFSRITMAIISSRKTRNKLLIAGTAFMINMGVMGLWHGLEWHYIAYGLYHGILLTGCEIYQKKSKFYRKHKKNRIFIAVEILITFHLVMFGFLIFSGRLGALIK